MHQIGHCQICSFGRDVAGCEHDDITEPVSRLPLPARVIEHAVWLYHCFSLSLRDVELILAARGIVVSYESIREWACALAGSSPMR